MSIDRADSEHRELARRAKAVLDERAETLPPGVVERLARARSRAVSGVPGAFRLRGEGWLRVRWLTLPRSTQRISMGIAMAGGAAAITAIVVALRLDALLERMPAQGLAAEDVELVAALNKEGDDLAMLEDLEFYSWLEAEPVDGAQPNESIG